MKARCLDCGYEWNRKEWAKTRIRCPTCKSRNAETMDESELVISTQSFDEGKKAEQSHRDPYASKFEKEVGRLRKEMNKLEKRINGEDEKKRLNELRHRRNQDLLLDSVREGFLGILGLKSEGNPHGHFKKAGTNIRNMLANKQALRNDGYDDRPVGENIRKLCGDYGGYFGFGIIPANYGGIVGAGILGETEAEKEEHKRWLRWLNHEDE